MSAEIRLFPLGMLQTNCYLLVSGGSAVAVDPGGDPGPVLAFLQESNLRLERILNTHLHFDHTAGNAALSRATGAPIMASETDSYLLESWLGRGGMMGMPVVEEYAFENLEPGDTELLGLECRILATPGHSPGSLTFHLPGLAAAFVGDVIFQRSIGRTDFPGGDMDILQDSIRRAIFSMPPETRLYPGHGPMTTVGDEKTHNPFFGAMSI
jgi:glyoxylase-like metal-dependent hydrolase (beta-lactamase superfamily II)